MNIAEVTVMDKLNDSHGFDGPKLTEEVVYTDPEDDANDIDG